MRTMSTIASSGLLFALATGAHADDASDTKHCRTAGNSDRIGACTRRVESLRQNGTEMERTRSAAAYVLRSMAYFDVRDYDRAIADADEASRLAPKYTGAHYMRGAAYGGKKDYDASIAAYTEEIRVSPKLVDAYFARGGDYHRKKNSMIALLLTSRRRSS